MVASWAVFTIFLDRDGNPLSRGDMLSFVLRHLMLTFAWARASLFAVITKTTHSKEVIEVTNHSVIKTG